MTDRQQLERLMYTLAEVREAQKRLIEKKRTCKNADELKSHIQDVRFKWDALDNLLKVLRHDGYQPVKHEETLPEQSKMF